MNIPHLPRAVTHRGCPDCGYVELQILIEQMRFDMDCPRCGKINMSAFVAVRLGPKVKPRSRPKPHDPTV